MMRRLNHTGRKQIPRSRVIVRLRHAPGSTYAFDARFDLADLGFPGDARLYVEAYNVTSYMRFAFGTVREPHPPSDTRLIEISPVPLPKFRLKVVDPSLRHGLLLGSADQLLPLRPDEDLAHKQPLLPVDFCDLGERIWRLDLTDWPVLELNSRIEGLAEAARTGDAFLALVYPEVVQRILHEIVVVENQTDPDFDDAAWTTLWLRYICSLPGVEPPPQGDSVEARSRKAEWIDEAVQAFCLVRQVRLRFEGTSPPIAPLGS